MDNRGGFGVSVNDALNNAEKHVAAGYSYQKACMDAWAVDLEDGSDEHARTVEFNNKISIGAGLPPAARLSLASFGGSHRNVFLRSVIAELQCSQTLLAPSGVLDAEYLVRKCPQLEVALQNGLEWNVISAEVVRAFPDLIPLAQKALNTRGTTDISEMEGLMTQYGVFEACIRNGDDRATAIATAVAESVKAEPFWSSWAKSLGKFTEKCTKEQLQELCEMRAAAFKAQVG